METEKNLFYAEKELKKIGFKTLGKDVIISRFAIIKHPEEINIGDHVAIDPFVYISVRMDIGNRVHISPFTGISGGKKSYCRFEDYSGCSEDCKLVCGSDDFSGIGMLNPTIPEKYRVIKYGQIILKKHSCLGTNVTVLPNVTICEGTVVGANSLVTKSLSPWGIYYGIPVKRRKERNKEIILKMVKELERYYD